MKRDKKAKASSAENKAQAVSSFPLIAVITYVAAVLTLDTLADHAVSWPFDWSLFHWQPVAWMQSAWLNRIDLFKLIFWLVIPFLFSLRTMEWSWLSPRGWKRNDWFLLGGLLIVGGIAIVCVKFIPTLHAIYPGMSHYPLETRLVYSISYLLWIASWLPGWEFMHRYFLLRVAMKRLPNYGWLLIPIFETVYHLQKPLLEAGGMAVFSLLLTWWCVKRRNLLLPFFAHLYIEVALLLALVFFL